MNFENENPWFSTPVLAVCGSERNRLRHWYIEDMPEKLIVSDIIDELI